MKKYIGLCFLAAMLAAPAVYADAAQDAAFDDRNNAVIDNRGNCVLTKWMDNKNGCVAAPKEEAAAPVVTPAPVPAPVPTATVVASKEARTVYFDFDSAALTIESQDKLKTLATLINGSTRVTSVRMVGFTDQYGTNDYNQVLSQKRVDAVRSYLDPLITLNIDPSTTEFRAAGKATDSKCDGVKNRPERIVCMKEERRVEVELGYETSSK
jgi:OOP family OmpA-OmpF porin